MAILATQNIFQPFLKCHLKIVYNIKMSGPQNTIK